jgi:methionyl-tRNA formyltransferase
MGDGLPMVVFFGSGEFGVPVLRALADAGRVALVVSQPDREAGRGKQLTPTPVSAFALERGLPLVRPEDCNEPETLAAIRAAARHAAGDAAAAGRAQPGPAFVVIAYGQKLSNALLDAMFAVNLHGSVLPRWRGAAPIQRALMEGDAEAGVTVISLAERMDAGLVHAVRTLPVGARQTAGELHDALSALGPEAVDAVLRAWTAGTLRGMPQDESRATRARKLSRDDSWADCSQPARLVRARINGLAPWPGCMVQVDAHPLKVLRAEECGLVTPARDPGTVDESGVVACGDGFGVRLLDVQPPNGRAMDWAAWRNGRGLKGVLRIGRIT